MANCQSPKGSIGVASEGIRVLRLSPVTQPRWSNQMRRSNMSTVAEKKSSR